MAKWHGNIGYGTKTEVEPGLWEDTVTVRSYYGELIRNNRRSQSSESVNDDITISNEISILADPYATLNFHAMLYAEFMGTKWKITSVDVQYPRLILSIGGVYNGQQATTAN